MRKVLWSNEDFNMLDELGAIEYAKEELINALKSVIKTSQIAIIANKVNWAGSSGFKVVDINDGIKAFDEIYPSYECTFVLYQEENEIYAVVSSHDIPTGATWYFEEVK